MAFGLVLVPVPVFAQQEYMIPRGSEAGRVPSSAVEVRQAQAVPLDIQEAIARALDANREVLDARLGLDLAEEQVDEAWGSLFPTLDFNGTYTRNVSPPVSFLPAIIFDPEAPPDEQIPVQFGADNAWNANFRLEQTIFEAGALIGVGAASRFRSLQRETVRGRAQAVVTQVRSAYYRLLLDVENLRLLENSVARVTASLEETQALNRAGLAPEYDVLRLEVELSNLRANLQRAENAVTQSRRQMAVLLDLENLEGVDVSGSLAEMDLISLEVNTPENQAILSFAGFDPRTQSLEQTIASAQAQRSDLRQLVLTEDLRRAELRLEQGDYLPSISAFGNYTVVAQQNGTPNFFGEDEQRATSKAIGITASLPIFTGTKRHNRIQQRQVTLKQAQTQTELVRDQAETQVKSLLDQVAEARQRALAQQAAVAQARRGFEIASAQYQEGLGSQLEITDAEEALRQSEFNYAQAVYDFLVARAQLDEAVGQVPGIDIQPMGFFARVN
jgi:outer membrane protein